MIKLKSEGPFGFFGPEGKVIFDQPGAGLAAWQLMRPDEGLELLCYVYAAPVIMVNGWEWIETEIVNKIQRKG